MSRIANIISTVPRTRGCEGLCSWRNTLGIPGPPLKSLAGLEIVQGIHGESIGEPAYHSPNDVGITGVLRTVCPHKFEEPPPSILHPVVSLACVRVHHMSSQKCMLTCCSGIFTERPRQAAPETEQHNDTSC